MQLIRFGQHYLDRAPDSLYSLGSELDNEKHVRAQFWRFGYGERKSEFGLNLHWNDVTTLIRAFAEMNHPEAVRLQNALKLVETIEGAGRRVEPPQSN